MRVFGIGVMALYAGPASAAKLVEYKFDGSGADTSGNGVNATLFGNATYGPGAFGSALQLDGAGDYAISNPPNGFNYSKFTIECWINVADYSQNVHYVSLSDMSNLVLGHWGAPLANTWADGLAPVDMNPPTGAPSPNVWHHLAFTFDGTSQRFYLDGVLTSTVATTGVVTANPALVEGLVIGARFDTAQQYVTGKIDNVRIWDTALPVGSLGYYLDSGCDADGDGYAAISKFCLGTDCNDSNKLIYPGAPESCDAVDSNCNGSLVDTFANFDVDSEPDCIDLNDDNDPDPDASDCNDFSITIYTGAPETIGDGIDQNCDKGDTCYADSDDDNYRHATNTVLSVDLDCTDATEALPAEPLDCGVGTVDTNKAFNPGAVELPGDEIDQNCDTTEVCYVDNDDDGSRSTSTVASTNLSCADTKEGKATDPLDCSAGAVDNNAAIYPTAVELPGDEIDQNCDTKEVCYVDNDDDGSRSTSTVASLNLSCADTKEGKATDPLDCSAGAVDNNAAIYPSAAELTGDEIDQNCDTKEVCFTDADDDGYRGTSTVASTNVSCADPFEGKASDPLDCSSGAVDSDKAINPGAPEVCDNVDQDCDGTADDGLPTTTYYADKDSDTFGSTKNGTVQDCDVVAPAGYQSDNTDCNDDNASVNTLATEVPYDGVDDDCKGGDLVDVDGDGFDAKVVNGPDCNDNSAAIHPGVVETVDGVDQDCNGFVDDNTDAFDDDGDGYTEGAGDCDDTAADVFPGALEVCDDVDQDCNLVIDNDTECYDDDGDGYDELTGDCDDTDVDRGPDIVENTTNGIDDDCDGKVDEGGTNDPDGDGITAAAGDCEPNNGAVYPGAPEIVNGKDDNCDGEIDEGTTAYDDDLDWFSEDDGDCDDSDADLSPDATELANGVDDNCDGTVDEGTNAFDDDGDGVTEDGGDCDDADGDVSPGASEKNNGIDDNCDGEIDEGFGDEDGDGLTAADGDCDDTNPNVVPGTIESCNSIDDNCDGEIDEGCDGDTGDEAKKCGCSTGTGVFSFLPLGLLGLLVRRRRGR